MFNFLKKLFGVNNTQSQTTEVSAPYKVDVPPVVETKPEPVVETVQIKMPEPVQPIPVPMLVPPVVETPAVVKKPARARKPAQPKSAQAKPAQAKPATTAAKTKAPRVSKPK
jgi:hypothetical protein